MSSTIRSKSPLRAWSSPSTPSAHDDGGVALGPQALGHEGGDARLVLHDQDAGHGTSGRAGRVITNRGPGRCVVDDGRPRRGGRARSRRRSRGRARTPRRRAWTTLRPKRSKMCARSASGTPGPVSRTHSRTDASSIADPIAIVSPLVGVLDGVVGELQHGLGDPLLVHRHDPLGGVVEVPVAVGQAAGLGQQGVGQPLQADGRGGEEVGAVGLGEQDQVADQPRHPVDLVEQQRAGLGDLVGVVGVEQLEVTLQHGERRLELVAGVVEELPLADERELEPGEHVVERAGERGDVVVARAPGSGDSGRSRRSSRRWCAAS